MTTHPLDASASRAELLANFPAAIIAYDPMSGRSDMSQAEIEDAALARGRLGRLLAGIDEQDFQDRRHLCDETADASQKPATIRRRRVDGSPYLPITGARPAPVRVHSAAPRNPRPRDVVPSATDVTSQHPRRGDAIHEQKARAWVQARLQRTSPLLALADELEPVEAFANAFQVLHEALHLERLEARDFFAELEKSRENERKKFRADTRGSIYLGPGIRGERTDAEKPLPYVEENAHWPIPTTFGDPEFSSCWQGRWIPWDCPDGHRDYMWVGCGRLDCVHCLPAVAVKRANRVWKRTQSLAESWEWVTFTVPPELRHLVKRAHMSAYRKAVWRAVAEWHMLMGHVGVGGCVYFHPVGSIEQCPAHDVETRKLRIKRQRGDDGKSKPTPCPICAAPMEETDDVLFHPHWNVGLPLVAVDGTNVQPIHHWRKPNEMEQLRRIWRVTLSEMLNLPLDAIRPTTEINPFREYRTGQRRIKHALRYFGRSFPGWSAWTRTTGGACYGSVSNRNWSATEAAVKAAGVDVKVEHIGRECKTCLEHGVEQQMAPGEIGSPCGWNNGVPSPPTGTGPPVDKIERGKRFDDWLILERDSGRLLRLPEVPRRRRTRKRRVRTRDPVLSTPS